MLQHFLATPPSSLLRNKETGLGNGCVNIIKVLPDIYEYAIVKPIFCNKYLKTLITISLPFFDFPYNKIIKTNTTFICLDVATEKGVYKLITTNPPHLNHTSAALLEYMFVINRTQRCQEQKRKIITESIPFSLWWPVLFSCQGFWSNPVLTEDMQCYPTQQQGVPDLTRPQAPGGRQKLERRELCVLCQLNLAAGY